MEKGGTKAVKNKAYPLYEVKDVTTLKELIDFRAMESPDKPAFAWTESGEKKEKTYGKLKQEIVALGASLGRRGMRKTKAAILGDPFLFRRDMQWKCGGAGR